MRLLAALALIAAVVLAPAGTACACSCAAFVPKEAMTRSAAVFTGTVKAVRRLPGSPLGPTPPSVVTFAVDQVYKGGRAATAEIATNADSASCGYAFKAGTRYLVFASSGAAASGLFATDPGTSLYSSLCAGNLELRPGTGPLRRGDEAVSPGALGQSVSKDLLAALGTPAAPVPVSPEASQETGSGSPVAAGSSPGGPSWWPIAGGAVATAVLVAVLAAMLAAGRPAGLARLARRR